MSNNDFSKSERWELIKKGERSWVKGLWTSLTSVVVALLVMDRVCGCATTTTTTSGLVCAVCCVPCATTQHNTMSSTFHAPLHTKQQGQTPTNAPPLNTTLAPFAVRCLVCANTNTLPCSSAALSAPRTPIVCNHYHTHHTTRSLCCSEPSPFVSCVRPTHSTTSTPHHTRFQCPISQCATSLHHPAQHTTKHVMCCLSLSSKHPSTHSKPLGCSMLSWSCSIRCPSAAVPL